MARKKNNGKSEHAVFDVLYEDGSQTSNRRMPASEISEFDRDADILKFFETEDQAIEQRSGRKRAAIKSIEPSKQR